MNKRILVAVLLGVFIVCSFSAQVFAMRALDIERMVADEINRDYMVKYVVDLCSGTMGPVGDRRWSSRTQGTPYGDISNAYIYNKFVDWGLDEVEIFENPTAANRYYLKTWEVSADGYTFSATWPCRWSPAGVFEGELIYVGAGTSDSDYVSKDVVGKIVLADGSASSVYRKAVPRGAIGILTDYPNDERYYTTWARCASIPSGSTRPGITISYMDGQNLKTLLSSGSKVTVRIMVDAEVMYGTSKSVIGTIKGRTNSDRYVILYGHADADAGNMGADDNAAGVACIMEIARAIMKLINQGKIPRPNFSIKFMAVGTEISDSRAYLEAHKDELDNIIAGCNFDQAGYGIYADLVNLEGSDIPFVQSILRRLMDVGRDYESIYWERENYQPIPYLGGSDHSPYVEVEVPTTYIWTDWGPGPRSAEQPPQWGGGEVFIDGCPYYHSSGDTPENTVLIEPWNMEWIARFAALLALRLSVCGSEGK